MKNNLTYFFRFPCQVSWCASSAQWCATGFGTVLELFEEDIYGSWQVRFVKKKVNLNLLCNPIVTTNNSKPFKAKVKQLVFKTCHAP